MKRKNFKLVGLNKPWKAAGFNSIYATVEYGKEDWFHSGFDSDKFSDEELNELFNTFKNSYENLWHDRRHEVTVECEYFSEDGQPIKPKIVELILDRITINQE